MYPGLTSWAKFSRPCGTKLANPGPHTPSCNCAHRGATQEYRRVCSTSARLRIVSDTHWCRMRQVRGARLQPVPFEDGRSVVSRVAVDRVTVRFCSPARGGCCYPVVTSWVSMEHWLQGSQVSKARPGAPFAFFRHGAFRRSCTG